MTNKDYLGLVFDTLYRWGNNGYFLDIIFYQSGKIEVGDSFRVVGEVSDFSDLFPFNDIVISRNYYNASLIYRKINQCLSSHVTNGYGSIYQKQDEPLIREWFLRNMSVK